MENGNNRTCSLLLCVFQLGLEVRKFTRPLIILARTSPPASLPLGWGCRCADSEQLGRVPYSCSNSAIGDVGILESV
jgi:hypothetical protein